ncbi:hypothetical protein AALP_AA4G229200 [Arabis alpina]|uniref:Embryo surrounding factor 1 brassicaceae domain-containing protein n=1 Tax=Arabis alpina TaxID=50452 RepID=A0A087H517_ARAAL|nr:hypothetical protein AALP_AA4G229200 [Arabis alpina]
MSSSHFAVLCIILLSLVPLLHGSGAQTQSLKANANTNTITTTTTTTTAGNNGKQQLNANTNATGLPAANVTQGLDSHKLGSQVCLKDRCPKHKKEKDCFCCFRDRRRCYHNLYVCASSCVRQPPHH